jgi:response regulator RpfG family c-di-GMP phosphodiesterase
MLKVIKLHLHEKYDVATAISGKVALKFLETKKTDLILLDYEMPEENGVQVLEKLRLNPDTMNIPVIFLTGITDRKKIQNALVMKPQGYLLKPIDRKKLLATIDDILG